MTQGRIRLDPIGQYFASIISPAQPGSFRITVHLKEELKPDILQQAVNDLMQRLPHLCGRLVKGAFWYNHEFLQEPPTIVPDDTVETFTQYYYKDAGHVLRVTYGTQSFTVETIHSICDGRTLGNVMRALLVRYFELLGVPVTDTCGIVDCSDAFSEKEMADVLEEFCGNTKSNRLLPRKTYRPHRMNNKAAYVSSRTFDASIIKAGAKSHNATITEYIATHIFEEIALDRARDNSDRPIAITIAVDCRQYFPTKTMRNFVSEFPLSMPEAESFSEKLIGIQEQFAEVDADSMRRELSFALNMRKMAFLPLFLKRKVIRLVGRLVDNEGATTFSNLGRVVLPPEIEERVASLEFVISMAKAEAYTFSCITVGDVLTLTVTAAGERDIAQRVFARLDGLGN